MHTTIYVIFNRIWNLIHNYNGSYISHEIHVCIKFHLPYLHSDLQFRSTYYTIIPHKKYTSAAASCKVVYSWKYEVFLYVSDPLILKTNTVPNICKETQLHPSIYKYNILGTSTHKLACLLHITGPHYIAYLDIPQLWSLPLWLLFL
jgi:hypothetical protein